MLHNYDYKESEFMLLLTRSETYVDEVASLSPVPLDGEVSYQGRWAADRACTSWADCPPARPTASPSTACR